MEGNITRIICCVEQTIKSMVQSQCNNSLNYLEYRTYLDSLSEEKAVTYLPVICFLVIVMFVGTIGNTLVISVFCYSQRRRPSTVFIVALAVYDLLASVIVIPIDIYDLRFHYTFFNEPACKLFRYFDNVTTYGSAIILIEIAFDRYIKVCKPLSINKCRKAMPPCILGGILAIIFSVPAFALFGITKTPIPNKPFCGYDCSISEENKHGLFQRIYYCVLTLVFIVTFLLLLCLYIKIWIVIRRHRVRSDGSSQKSNTSPEIIRMAKRREKVGSNSSTEGDDSVFLKDNSSKPKVFTSSRLSKFATLPETIANVRCTRTTKIFIIVSIAFVLSYMPGVVVMVTRSLVKDLETRSSEALQAILKLFARFHFLNNAINPIIYSFLNANFRNQLMRTTSRFLKLCKIRKRSNDNRNV